MSKLNLVKFRRIMYSKNIPFFALPKTKNPEDVLNYRISPVTVKRKIKIGSTTKTKIVRITSSIQKKIYRKLINMRPSYPPYIIGISSEPHDAVALETAGNIHFALAKRNPSLNCKWWNSWEFPSKDTPYYDVVIIYNVSTESDSSRLTKIRDIINHFNKSLRIIVVSGTNAVDYFDNYLHQGISGMVHVVGYKGSFIKPAIKDKKDKIVRNADQVFSPELINLLFNVGKKVKKLSKKTQ